MSVVVAAPGTAVRDNGDVSVTFQAVGAKIARNTAAMVTQPIVYIPITNPESTTKKLKTVRVDFDGGPYGGTVGMVDTIGVAYGPFSIYNSGTDLGKTNTFSEDVEPYDKRADNYSYGINVSLTLNLPDPSSFVTLYSVALTFSDK